jgi:hypothetical protein
MAGRAPGAKRNSPRAQTAGTSALGFTVNSGQPKEGVAELLAAAGFAHARIVARPKLFCAIASKPT